MGDSYLMRIESREILERGSFPLSGIKVLAFAFLGVASSTALARAQQMPPPQAAPQPVIPEDEFEQAVPPLDSELDRPLESLDAFEQEQSDGDQREEVAAPPTMVQGGDAGVRSEEHTSELQSLMRTSYAVFCLKKKKTRTLIHT